MPLVNPTFDRDTIDLEEIKRISSRGLDGCPPEDRALAWLSMLHTYPLNPMDWKNVLDASYDSYWMYVKEYHLDDWHKKQIPNQCPRDIYGLHNNSQMAIIHGDIVRTGRIIFFFPPKPIEGAVQEDAEDMIFQFGEHARRLERVLYIFSTLNPGFGYMQGYNELLPPFYYVLLQAQALLGCSIDRIESLAFQCFQTLLVSTTLHELYMTGHKSEVILHKLNDFSILLQKHLPLVHAKIEKLGIHPLLYCYRWYNLLFSQEHDLPFLLPIWDALFSHFDELVDYSFYVGLGHIKMVEEQILKGDYGTVLSSLQRMENLEVKSILAFSNMCWEKDHVKQKSGFMAKLFGN